MTNRKLREAGIYPLPAYVLILVVFLLISEYLFSKTTYANYLLMLVCLSFQFKLTEKNRTDFLRIVFGDKVKNQIRILENCLISIPFVAFLLFKLCFTEAGILLVFSILIALINTQANFNYTIPTPYSKRPFEFTVGFRNSFLIFPMAYTLTIIAISVNNFNLGMFSMMLNFLIFLSFYTIPEQQFYVWIHAARPKIFLLNKILNATQNALIPVFPIALSLIIFFPAEFKIVLIFILIGLLFLWSIILLKYSNYPHDTNLADGIIFTFCFLFPPLLLALIPFYYNKSVKRLQSILYD